MATIRQLEQALIAADAAGDTESAQILAAELQRVMSPPVPEAPVAKPKTGFMPALKSGKESLVGDIYAGLAGLGVEGAEAKSRAQKEKAAALYQQPEFLEHPVDYVTGLLGQSLPYMAAPVVAGAAASPLGALAAMGAAGAASATQFVGSDLSRQLDTGKTGEQLEVGKAIAAAIPQAALDVIGFRYVPGIRTLFGKAGIPITEEAAKGIAGRYILPAAKTAGIEGATEAGQQVFERLQAGLSLTDAEAKKEYFENFLGGAVLGGTLAIPGTMLEGRPRPREEAVAPEVATEVVPTPERERGEITTIPPTERGEIGVAKYRPPETAPEVAVEEPAPTELAAPEPNVIDLMDQYAAAQPRVDALREQMKEAAVAGDTTKVRELSAQVVSERESLSGLKNKIEELGGVAQTAEEFAKTSADTMGALDKKIKTAQKALSDAGELGDEDKIPKLADRLDALKAERAKLENTFAEQSKLLNIQATPKGETLSLFAADEAQPKSTKVLEAGAGPLPPETGIAADYGTLNKYVANLENIVATLQAKKKLSQNEQEELNAAKASLAEAKTFLPGKVDEEAIAAKEAEAERQATELVQLVKTGPQAVSKERQDAAMAEVNAARERLSDLKEAAQTKPAGTFDEEIATANIKLKQAMDNLQTVGKRDIVPRHITDVNTKSEQLNKLYDEIDALRGGKPAPTESPLALFQRDNLLRTAVVNNDKKAIDILQRAQKEADKRGQRGLPEQEKLLEKMQQRFDLPGTTVKRVVDEEEYDSIMDKVETQMRKITSKQGNAKESYIQKAERLWKEMETFKAASTNKEATPHQRAMARRTYNAKLKEYETILNGQITPAREAIHALYGQLYTKKEVGKASEIAAEKAKETERAGREEREVSTEVKRAKKLEEGKGIKASPARVARDIGYETEAYQTLAAVQQKKVDAKVAQYNAFVNKAKDQLAKIKEKKGDVSDAYKTKEAAFVKEANERLKTLNAFKQSVADALDTKAEALGRAAPEMRSKLLKATEKRKETVAAPLQKKRTELETAVKALEEKAKDESLTPKQQKGVSTRLAAAQSALTTFNLENVASKRTAQETRKVAKLGTMTTGTPESKARSAAKQAVFEDKTIKPEAQARVEQAVKEVNKKPSEAKGNAMKTAFTKAAQKKAGPAFRTEGSAAGVVDPTEAKGRIVEIKSRLPKGMNLIYEPTLADMKQETLDMLKAEGYKEGTSFKGVVLGDGTIVVVGDQHTNMTDLEETLYHEMVGHYGIDTVIGLDRLQKYALDTDLEKLAKDLGGMSLWVKALDAMTFAKEQKGDPDLAALREIIAYTAQQRVTESFYAKASRFIKELIGMMRDALRSMGFKNMPEMSASDVFNAIRASDTAFQNRTLGPYRAADGTMAFRSKQEPASIAPSFVAKDIGTIDKLKANFLGITGRVQFVDQYAALSEALKKGVDSKKIAALEAEQAEYYLRFGQQRSQYAGQFLTNGPVSLVKQETKRGKEFIYSSKPGANMMQVADAIAPSKIGNDTEKEAILTALLAGERAKQVGWAKLNFENPGKVEQEYNQVKALLDSRPQDKAMFDKAMGIYKEYNNGLIDFLVQTGTMTEKKAAELKAITYVPFYRVNKGTGEIELMVDKEHPVRIGNIKDEPQLKELIGDSTEILPVFTSAVQNTFMLTEMALRNQMVKENAFMLNKIGVASTLGKGTGPASSDTVRFKHKGEDHFVVIDTDLYGIPASLIVKGMEGIKTTMPAAIRMLGMPADILRKFVTRNPAYAVKQAIRDPLTAWMTTGVDGVPVLNSMTELVSMVAGRSEAEKKLMASGAISSNVFTGDKGDMDKFLKEISMGRSGWQKIMARADAFALQGDAATRAVIYKDSLNKGMSEMQAMLRTLESMNFSRRGLSPSMQMASVLIPFFNAQIQGLDVLYRAFKGDMPYSQQLEIRKKLVARGLLLAAGTIAYAAMMEDDEAYKNAKPEERLGNWFLPTPFSDEPLRIPIPFELGYLFKALPEAVYNMAAEDERNNDITKGMTKLVMLSNPFSLPQAIKPATEVYLGKSFFGGDIESQREIHSMVPTERYRTSTSEISKMIGSITGDIGLSPIKLDYLIRGYTGGLGIALVSLANPLMNTEAVEAPTMKTSKMPFIGGLFQPVEGRGTLDAAYERMLEIQQAKGTYDALLQQGKRDEALAFRDEYVDKISAASVSGTVQQKLGELAKLKRQVISAPNLTTERKDELLKRLDMQQNILAKRLLAISDRTTLQSAPT